MKLTSLRRITKLTLYSGKMFGPKRFHYRVVLLYFFFFLLRFDTILQNINNFNLNGIIYSLPNTFQESYNNLLKTTFLLNICQLNIIIFVGIPISKMNNT